MKVHLLRVHNTAKRLFPRARKILGRMDPSLTLACLPSTVGPAQLRTRMFLQCRWYRNL